MIQFLAGAGSAAFYGLFLASLYALVGMGVVLIFRSTRTVNFAHGQFAVTGGFVFLQSAQLMHMPVAVGLLLGALTVVVLSLVWGRMSLSMERRGDDLIPLIGSFGLFLALDGIAVMIWGGQEPFVIAPILPEFQVKVAGTVVDSVYLWILATFLICSLLLGFFMQRTSVGLKLRASVQNREAAELIGIPTRRMALIAWVIGSILAFVALMLFVPRSYLEDTSMQAILLSAFAAAAVGGFESFSGAALGALVLGIAEALSGRYIASSLQAIVPLIVIILMIFANPRGAFVVRGQRQ
jgi:branched-chain amino acid transport system permease protein